MSILSSKNDGKFLNYSLLHSYKFIIPRSTQCFTKQKRAELSRGLKSRKQHGDRSIHTLGTELTKGRCLCFSGRLNSEDIDVFIFRMTFWCPPYFFLFFFPKPTQTENTWTLKGHLLSFLILPSFHFQGVKTLWYSNTSVSGSERPAGWKKRQRSGYPLISAMHWWPCQLYGQFAQESSKNPLWRMTCGSRLNSWANWILLK